ncbi:hypothetical protein [Piscinibacter sp.]|uniref:hypothetical protein n=1 Tax=Piscinibacter sp. TaxID=1903157 RepID=UPI0039E21F82
MAAVRTVPFAPPGALLAATTPAPVWCGTYYRTSTRQHRVLHFDTAEGVVVMRPQEALRAPWFASADRDTRWRIEFEVARERGDRATVKALCAAELEARYI